MSITRTTSTVRNVLIATASVAAVTAVAMLLIFAPGPRDEIEYTCGGQRVVALDLSSQNRSDATVSTAVDVIAMHTLAAAVCSDPLTVLGVAGGRQELIVPTTDFLADVRGPNPRARAHAVADRVDDVRSAVAQELDAVFAAYPSVDTTSVAALFEAAGAQLVDDSEGRIVLLTTGVNVAEELTLNRPLESGEGRVLAQQVVWPTLGADVAVVAIGVTQMDGDVPAPGDLWPREVMAFVEEACTLTEAGSCHVYQVASIEKVLL